MLCGATPSRRVSLGIDKDVLMCLSLPKQQNLQELVDRGLPSAMDGGPLLNWYLCLRAKLSRMSGTAPTKYRSLQHRSSFKTWLGPGGKLPMA